MPAVLLTEPERRALIRWSESQMHMRIPLAPRWLRRAIAERVVVNLSTALADPARSEKAQAAVAVALAQAELMQNAKPAPSSNSLPSNTIPA